jgi:hypothetical protein
VHRKGDTVHIVAPQHAMGRIFGEQRRTLEQLQQETKCDIKVDKKMDDNGHVKTWRAIQVRSKAPKASECEISLDFCSRVIQTLLQDFEQRVEEVLISVRRDMDEESRRNDELRKRRQQNESVQQLLVVVGDMFSEVSVRDALFAENWDPDLAQDRLFRELHAPKHVVQQPSLNVQRLLEVCRAKNTERKARESKHGQKGQSPIEELAFYKIDQRGVDSSASTAASDSESDKPSKDVQMIRDVFEEARRKGNEMQQKQTRTTELMALAPPEHGKKRPSHSQPKSKTTGLANKTKY